MVNSAVRGNDIVKSKGQLQSIEDKIHGILDYAGVPRKGPKSLMPNTGPGYSLQQATYGLPVRVEILTGMRSRAK